MLSGKCSWGTKRKEIGFIRGGCCWHPPCGSLASLSGSSWLSKNCVESWLVLFPDWKIRPLTPFLQYLVKQLWTENIKVGGMEGMFAVTHAHAAVDKHVHKQTCRHSHACTQTCAHTHTHTHTHTQNHTHTHNTHTHTHTHTHTQTQSHTHTHKVHTHTHTNTNTNTHTHTQSHTHTHTHTHTQQRVRVANKLKKLHIAPFHEIYKGRRTKVKLKPGKGKFCRSVASTGAVKQAILWCVSSSFPFHVTTSVTILCLPIV